jgi:hypothetical protein
MHNHELKGIKRDCDTPEEALPAQWQAASTITMITAESTVKHMLYDYYCTPEF